MIRRAVSASGLIYSHGTLSLYWRSHVGHCKAVQSAQNAAKVSVEPPAFKLRPPDAVLTVGQSDDCGGGTCQGG